MRQVVTHEQRHARDAEGHRALGEETGAETTDLRARDPVRPGPASHEERRDEDGYLRVAADEHEHDEDRDERGGDGGNDLRERIGGDARRTPPARNHGDGEPAEDTRQTRDDGDDQRRARAGENEAEQIAAEHIGAQRIDLAGREGPLQISAVDGEEDRLVWGDALTEQREEEQREECEKTDGEPRIDAAHLDDLTGWTGPGFPLCCPPQCLVSQQCFTRLRAFHRSKPSPEHRYGKLDVPKGVRPPNILRQLRPCVGHRPRTAQIAHAKYEGDAR